jgi:hypothetical protein
MLLLMKHLIVPFTLGAVVITTSFALSLLQVRNCFCKCSLSANHVNIIKAQILNQMIFDYETCKFFE